MAPFSTVTLLITHYNRSKSLERLLSAFKQWDCVFGDVVVSDDGSKPEHIEYLEALQQKYPFRLVKTPVNKGLGNNINKGQDAVTTPYTLYVQEDFIPTDLFRERLAGALGPIWKATRGWTWSGFTLTSSIPTSAPWAMGFGNDL